jgi:hypothetical protein
MIAGFIVKEKLLRAATDCCLLKRMKYAFSLNAGSAVHIWMVKNIGTELHTWWAKEAGTPMWRDQLLHNKEMIPVSKQIGTGPQH